MDAPFVILLLAALSLCTSCGCGRHDSSVPSVENPGRLDLSDVSNEKFAVDLEGLKMILSDIRDRSEFHFTGTQSKLDEFLDDMLLVYPKDQFKTTWVPEAPTDDGDLRGVIQFLPFPEHLEKIKDYVHQYEQELERRKRIDGEQAGADQPTAAVDLKFE